MVKSVLGVNHQGLRDWVIQRISAIVIGLYSLGILFYLGFHPDITYNDWHFLFTHLWVKVMTILFLVALMFHAWVGMWTVFTDYVKSSALRFWINTLVFLALSAFLIEGLTILWGTH